MPKYLLAVLSILLLTSVASAQSISQQPEMVLRGKVQAVAGKHAAERVHLTSLLANSTSGQESLARYHEWMKDGTLPLAAKGASETVGSSQGFKVYNYITSNYQEIEFTLSVQTPRFNIWVETAELNNGHMDATRLEALRVALEDQTPAASFDPNKGVLELDEAVFGQPTDVDSNGKSEVLVLDIRDGYDPTVGGASIQGFVDPNNLSGVNLRDILHLDTFPSLANPANADALYLTAAHEYQHLIRFRYDPSELTFVDEGLSEWAEVMTGYGPRRNTYWSLPSELRRPLLGWRGQLEDGVDYDYQRAGLFTNYLAQRIGVLATGSITRSPGAGASGYASVLNGQGIDFKQLLAEFHVANVVNDAAVDTRFSQGVWFPEVKAAVSKEYDGTAVTSASVRADGQGSNPSSLEPGSAVYHRWNDVANFNITFDALPGSGSLASMRQRIRAYVVARPASGAAMVEELIPGGEGVNLSGEYRSVTLVAAHVDISLPGGFNSSWAPFTYTSNWVPGTIGASVSSVVYENGNVVVVSETGGSTTLDAWPFSASTLGVEAQVANEFEVPDGAVLSSVQVANFYASYFDTDIPQNPRNYTLTVRPQLPNGRPGSPVVEISRTDVGPAPTIPGIGFDEIDLSSYADQLQALSGTLFVAVTNAGTDQNTLVIPLAEWANAPADNPSWFYLNFGGTWSWANFANITLSGEPRFEDRVAPIRATFTLDTSTADESDPVLPARVSLEPNYPNPFNPRTSIVYSLPAAGEVRLAVHDVLGRQVALLVDGTLPAGRHETSFDGSGLPSGLYLYTIEAQGIRTTRSMLLLK